MALLQRDYGRQAGVDGLAVDDDGAGAALPQAAPELGAVEAKLAAQGVKQRRRRVDIEPMRCAVDCQRDHGRSLLCRMSRTRVSRSVQAGAALYWARRKASKAACCASASATPKRGIHWPGRSS